MAKIGRHQDFVPVRDSFRNIKRGGYRPMNRQLAMPKHRRAASNPYERRSYLNTLSTRELHALFSEISGDIDALTNTGQYEAAEKLTATLSMVRTAIDQRPHDEPLVVMMGIDEINRLIRIETHRDRGDDSNPCIIETED